MDAIKKYLVNKVTSRKFQVLIIAVITFYTSNQFTGDHLVWAMGVYTVGNALEKFAHIKK